jgi:hypothetical protein
VTEEQWQEIEKTLLPGMDRAHFRQQIERIASDDATPAHRLKRYYDRIVQCRQFLAALPGLEMIEDKPAWAAQIERQIQQDQQMRDLCRGERSYRFVRECEVLLLWQSRGGELPISNSGAHVDFFAAVYVVVFGKPAPEADSIRNIVKDLRHLQRVRFDGAGNLSACAEIIRPDH